MTLTSGDENFPALRFLPVGAVDHVDQGGLLIEEPVERVGIGRGRARRGADALRGFHLQLEPRRDAVDVAPPEERRLEGRLARPGALDDVLHLPDVGLVHFPQVLETIGDAPHAGFGFPRQLGGGERIAELLSLSANGFGVGEEVAEVRVG